MMAEIVAATAAAGSIICQAKTILWTPLMNKIDSSNEMEEIYEALNEAMAMLGAKRDDYQNQVQRNKIKRPSKTYNEWVHRVMKIEDQVGKLVTRYEKVKKRPNYLCFVPRADFSKEMKKEAEKLDKLWERGGQLGQLFVDQPPEPIMKIKTPEISNFPTLQSPLDDVRRLLTRDNIKGIRIVGTIGVGKTTIMQNLNNHEDVAKMFNMVLWLKVSSEGSKENLSIEQLQLAILQRLKVDMINLRDHQFAHSISEELKDKKYLLLLDDVKQDLDLNQIGIPDGTKGSKIVLTTRLAHVCSTMVNMVVKVKTLSIKESRNMFQNILDRPDLKDNSEIEPLMRQVITRCGCLPLVIKMVASAFRTRDTEVQWSDGLKSLKIFPRKEDQGMKEMYRFLSFCYDNLNDSRKKNCFLFGALYPEDKDIYIDCLLDCLAAENFLSSDDDTEDARINGRLILEHLKNVSLLEEGKSWQYIKMHKCIRQTALYILSSDSEHKSMVKTSEALQTPPIAEYWEDKNWISLVDNELRTLPESPYCPKLSILLIQKNPTLKEIPSSFFEHTSDLRVLDLHYTGIVSLPSTLSKLARLRVLYLNACKDLRKLPSQIGELQLFEVLDIRGNGIDIIPSDIRKLICLRRLLVSFTNFENQDVIDSCCNVISKLSKLKELFIEVNSKKERCDRMLSDVIKMVTTSTKLTTLQFCFQDETVDVIKVLANCPKICVPKADILEDFFEKRNDLCFQSFRVLIGCQISLSPQLPNSSDFDRYVKHCGGEDSNNVISKVLLKADAFELVNHNDVKHLSKFDIRSMDKVRGCLIQSCNEMKTIVDGNDSPILPNLEQFYINDLPKLESIWGCRLPSGSLSKLETLVLNTCPMLIKIFSYGMIQQPCEVRELKIEDCSAIEEVITAENVGSHPCVLPKLKKLVLVDLPNLKRVSANESLNWPSLERLEIRRCPQLKTLPLRKDNALELKSIEIEQDCWEALQWQDLEVKDRFHSYCTFS